MKVILSRQQGFDWEKCLGIKDDNDPIKNIFLKWENLLIDVVYDKFPIIFDCGTEHQWIVTEPELLKEILATYNMIRFQPCCCIHMIQID